MKLVSFKIFKIPYVVLLLLLLGTVNSYAQIEKDSLRESKKWYVSFDYGIQMSGIKSEDFIWSNYSPVYRLSLGREISPNLSVQVGYQGRYFRAISDELRYTYDYFFIEGRINATNIILGKNPDRKYNLLFHAGPGFFYHHIYDRTSVHGNLGAASTFLLNENFDLKFDLSAIFGWDIYQGDDDILPNATLGVIYHF